MTNKRRFLYLGLALVAGLGLFGGGFWLARSWLGLPRPNLAAPDGVVGEKGPIGLVFSQPMDIQTVEKTFRIDPAVKGHFMWGGNTLWFFPEPALSAGTDYTIYITTGARSTGGRSSTRDESWKVTVREPEIIYLAPAGETANLWAQPAGGGAARQLTEGLWFTILASPAMVSKLPIQHRMRKAGSTCGWKSGMEARRAR